MRLAEGGFTYFIIGNDGTEGVEPSFVTLIAPPNAHSVVISQANGHILVPSGKTGGFCGGCILVFGEK